eukprot:gene16615-10490_t
MPTAWEVCRMLCICFVTEDTLFYWTHRAMHHKLVYAKVHKMHHEFKVPCAMAAEYAHPLEYFLSNAVPYAAGPMITGVIFGHVHVFATWIWGFLRVWEAVDGHSGYRVECSPFALFPFRPSAADHDWHHSKNAGNFASFFPWWDHFMGTSQHHVMARLEAKKAKSKSK